MWSVHHDWVPIFAHYTLIVVCWASVVLQGVLGEALGGDLAPSPATSSSGSPDLFVSSSEEEELATALKAVLLLSHIIQANYSHK